MTVIRSGESVERNNAQFDELWNSRDYNTYYTLRMIDNIIDYHGPGWGIRPKLETATIFSGAVFGYCLGPATSYLPDFFSSYIPDYSNEVMLRALQSDAGKTYLANNRDAIAEVILQESANLESSTGIISIIAKLAQYVQPPKSYQDQRAERYMYMQKYRGLPGNKADFIQYMSKLDGEGGILPLITSWCQEFPGDKQQYAQVVANAIHAAQFTTDNFYDGMYEVQTKYVSQAINAYVERNGYNKVKEEDVLRLIMRFTVREGSEGEMLPDSSRKKYGDMYDKLTEEQASIWTVEATLDFIPSVLKMQPDNIRGLVQYGIKQLKSSYKNGGVPSGIAFSADNNEAWPANGDDRYHNNFYGTHSKRTIIDELAESIPDIVPLFEDMDDVMKSNIVELTRAINDPSIDKMRLLYGSIIKLLQSSPALAKVLGTAPHVERISKLILGLAHASMITNNFAPDKLDLLGYKVGGKPLLQSLQPLLTNILSTALNAKDEALYGHIKTLLTSLYVDQETGSYISDLLGRGFTRNSINTILSSLPDDGSYTPDIGQDYVKSVCSVRTDLSEDEATALAHNTVWMFQSQKTFQQKKVHDIYTSIENILAHKKIQGIGEEIKSLHTIMQVINEPALLTKLPASLTKLPELRKAIGHLNHKGSLLPLGAFIAENRENLKKQLTQHLQKGNFFTQYLLCPLLCIIDLDLATALRAGKVTHAKRLQSLLLVLPAATAATATTLFTLIIQFIKLIVFLPNLLYTTVRRFMGQEKITLTDERNPPIESDRWSSVDRGQDVTQISGDLGLSQQHLDANNDEKGRPCL